MPRGTTSSPSQPCSTTGIILAGKYRVERLLGEGGKGMVVAARHIHLEVRESNEAARKLYERQGFGETGRRRNYYDHPAEDALLLQLILNR